MKWVPVDLIQFALTNNKIQELRLYLILKHEYAGGVMINKAILRRLQLETGRCRKSLSKDITSLESLGWTNSNKGFTYIRSFKRLYKMLKGKSAARVEFDRQYLQCPKAYFAGAFIGRLVMTQRNRYRKNKKSANQAGQNYYMGSGSYHDLLDADFFPVANTAIAKMLQKSIMYGSRLKKSAVESGYLLLKANYSEVSIRSEDLNTLRSIDSEFENKYIKKTKGIMERGPDLIKSLLQFKYGKKWYDIKGDYKGGGNRTKIDY